MFDYKRDKYLCSVVITTHNRPALLYESLVSLADQTLAHSNYEIIVIDNYSDDGGEASQDTCDRIKKKFPTLHLTYLMEKIIGGVTFSRNRAMTIAQAPIVFFGDDDYLASSILLEEGLRCFNDPTVAIVAGSLTPQYESPVPEWVEYLWEKHPHGKYLTDFTLINLGNEIREISPEFAFWSNWAIRKSIFTESPGFGPDGFGGEFVKYNGNGEHMLNDYVHKRGDRILFCPKMAATHRIFSYRFTLSYFQSRYFYYGIGESFVSTRIARDKLNYLNIILYSTRLLVIFLREIFQLPSPLRSRKYWQWKGFIFHQCELRKDSNLLDYCLLKSWKDFDFNLLKKSNLKKPSLWR